MKTPDQETVLKTLRDGRYNIKAVCERAGVSRYAVKDRFSEQGGGKKQTKKPLRQEELDALWQSMDIIGTQKVEKR